MKKRILLWLLLFAGFARAERPHVLFIMVDDLGYGDLSSYGATDLKSPHIDALVKSGMRFNQFYANCPVCSPTRAAFIMGSYPDLVGVPGVIRTHQESSWGYLDARRTSIAKAFKSAAYDTALVGKWHLGLSPPNTPNDHGFDYFHGWLGDMMDDYYKHRRHGIPYMALNREIIEVEGHATDLFTQWAVDYLDRRRDTGRPFFLFLSYNAPHTPIQPPPDWTKKVKAREPGITDKRAKLVALVEHCDHGIGRVIAALKKNGLDKNTLVVFTSDNGGQVNVGASNGSLTGEKQEMWEGGIRVATCVAWPGKIKAGSSSEYTGMTMDFYPTLCEAAGIELKQPVDGRSFLPLLLGKDFAPPERTMIWVRREGGAKYGGRVYYAARRGPWKLLQNTPYEPMRLFNLSTDPKERVPHETNHPMYRKLSGAIRQHINASGRIPWAPAVD
jgi:arylsulfatase A-like enzyme